jgi:hypothetical protein
VREFVDEWDVGWEMIHEMGYYGWGCDGKLNSDINSN